MIKEIGASYNKLGDQELALSYYQKALYIAKVVNGEGSMSVAKVYLDMAEVYRDSGQTDKQMECLESSLSLYERHGVKRMCANVYHDMAKMFQNEKNYEGAVGYYTKSIEYEIQSGESFNLGKYYLNRASAYYAQDDYEAFLIDNTKAYQIFGGLPIQSELTEEAKNIAVENFKYYYDNTYEGDKNQGFEAWMDYLMK